MKKIFAITLVLVMMLAMSVTVFAAGEIQSVTEGSNTAGESIVVTVTNEYADPDKTYYVDVEWTDTDIAITNTVEGATWNPETHTYEGGSTTSSVTDGQAAVKVTNHSNAAVNAAVSATELDGLTITCGGPVSLADASLEAYDDVSNAPNATISITVELASVDTVIAEGTYNFTVTVTITAP